MIDGQAPEPAAPAPMEGHGGYNARSAVQASGAAPELPLLEQAARDATLLPGTGPVAVADYGSSQGRNSLAPIGLAVRTLRGRLAEDRAISVIHTDLPDNDFSALFDLLDRDPGSYLKADAAVFASAVGRSFYDQMLPAATVTLGWSAWSVQWLSRAPLPIQDQVHVAYSRDEPVRAAFALQAAQDWHDFLRHRARELHPGGRLVVMAMAATDNGDFGYRPVMTAMYDTLCALVAEGVVQQDEAARMVIPTYGRTRDEFAAPFAPGIGAGLTLEHLEMVEGEDTIWRDYRQTGDATAFGARWAAFSRASVLPTLARGLGADAGPDRTRDVINRMETGMARHLAAAPERSLMPLAMIVASRPGTA